MPEIGQKVYDPDKDKSCTKAKLLNAEEMWEIVWFIDSDLLVL